MAKTPRKPVPKTVRRARAGAATLGDAASASPQRSNGWRPRRRAGQTSPPPMPLSGTRTGRRLTPVAAGQSRRDVAAEGHRPGARHAGGEHRAVRRAGFPPTTRCCGARAAWASLRWSRRSMPTSMPRMATSRFGKLKLVEIHREDIESLPELMALMRGTRTALHRVLRRPVVRGRRHVLQVAQGGAGRRHRGPAGQRGVLRHLQPPPPAWRAT